VIDHATVVMPAPGSGPLAGPDQGRLSTIEDGAILVAGDRFAMVGPRESVWRALAAGSGAGAVGDEVIAGATARGDAATGVGLVSEVFDARHQVVMPGLVDAHTHLVWAGSRAAEFERRVAGASYLEIMAAGGGIASTMRATRSADDDALLDGILARLDRLMAFGVTTVEAKTGYGLDPAEELRHLRLLAVAAARHPVRIVPTFLGAHAVPDAYRGREDDYVDLVVEEMLPAVATAHAGAFCDVFCDDGAFTVAQTARILRGAAALGLPLKVHSDEFAHLGCTALAAELGATSADHLVVTTPAEMDAMAARGVVAVLLPGTTLGLGSTRFAAAREMVARRVPVALGTDLNPGTCPCENLPLTLALAARYMHLTPAEGLVAATTNAAFASGRGDVAGRLAAGRPADLVVLATRDYRDLAYCFGGNPVTRVMTGGAWTVLD